MTIVGLLTIFVTSTRDLNWDWRDIWISLAYMGAVFAMSIWFGWMIEIALMPRRRACLANFLSPSGSLRSTHTPSTH